MKLIVKGPLLLAKQSAEDHGVDIDCAEFVGKFGEILIRGQLDDCTAAEWLNEPPHHAPFVPGSLLWYAHDE